MNLEDIYIGLVKKALTISVYSNEQEQWSFEIDGNVLFEDIKNAWQKLDIAMPTND
jgi:hypothetical protein